MILRPTPMTRPSVPGGVIQQALALGLPIHVVFLTYGDNNEWSFVKYRKKVTVGSKAVEGMGLVRHEEAIKATGVLGSSGKAPPSWVIPILDAADLGEHLGRLAAFRSTSAG